MKAHEVDDAEKAELFREATKNTIRTLKPLEDKLQEAWEQGEDEVEIELDENELEQLKPMVQNRIKELEEEVKEANRRIDDLHEE